MKLILTHLLVLLAFSAFAQKANTLVVYFDYNKFNITPSAMASLDSFLRLTTLSQVTGITLGGHCDSIGNNEYNDTLSFNRVTAVKNYLQNHQVSPDLFKDVKGFGKRQPVNNNSNAMDRAFNRRVEILITEMESKNMNSTGLAIVAPKQPERTLEENIRDTNIIKGSTLVLKNLNFIGGRHVLLPQSVPYLTELLQVLQANPTLEIEIDGHICCTFGAEDGIDLDNGAPDLSVNRAKAVYEYLIGHGISKKRLSYKGFAHSMPIVYPEDTEEKKTINRRVEIKIIRK